MEPFEPLKVSNATPVRDFCVLRSTTSGSSIVVEPCARRLRYLSRDDLRVSFLTKYSLTGVDSSSV